jgi:hypothetical protein
VCREDLRDSLFSGRLCNLFGNSQGSTAMMARKRHMIGIRCYCYHKFIQSSVTIGSLTHYYVLYRIWIASVRLGFDGSNLFTELGFYRIKNHLTELGFYRIESDRFTEFGVLPY